MEGKVSRGRGGVWRRGGRGGHDGDGGGGDHRGRGRAGHHRGRGRRDHYRGRGRGGGVDQAAEFHYRDQGDGDSGGEEEVNRRETFSRRKLESNWDRYQESERQEPDDDMPTQRGTDYHVLLESAGDSFTQFRFVEEKDWEMDSFTAAQMSTVVVDLPALAQTLQQVPLHQRLNLEAELLQVLTPVDLPTVIPAPKHDTSKAPSVPPASTPIKGLGISSRVTEVSTNKTLNSNSQVSSKVAEQPADDGDEELDLLLTLDKPPVSVTDEDTGVACENVKEVATEEKMEEVKEKDVTPPKSVEGKKDMTEEDLEDWLDSMIS
ncbi:cell death regulator Aven [Solea solea]|uniref:cell death regulator Aven n=1 Tax=Solea solea TaxID=90069 RepID=UPI0027295949|nr:cell death regulator Aven [Solea solea]